MSSSNTVLFWMGFCFVFFINIVTPTIAAGLGQSYNERDLEDADVSSPPAISATLIVTGLNILLVPFWTVAMPFYMNLFIMIPIRVLVWITAWKLISPASS